MDSEMLDLDFDLNSENFEVNPDTDELNIDVNSIKDRDATTSFTDYHDVKLFTDDFELLRTAYEEEEEKNSDIINNLIFTNRGVKTDYDKAKDLLFGNTGQVIILSNPRADEGLFTIKDVFIMCGLFAFLLIIFVFLGKWGKKEKHVNGNLQN